MIGERRKYAHQSEKVEPAHAKLTRTVETTSLQSSSWGVARRDDMQETTSVPQEFMYIKYRAKEIKLTGIINKVGRRNKDGRWEIAGQRSQKFENRKGHQSPSPSLHEGAPRSSIQGR